MQRRGINNVELIFKYGDSSGRRLATFYIEEASDPERYSDEEIFEIVQRSQPGASVEGVFLDYWKRLSTACARRPQLTPQFLRTQVRCVMLMPLANPGPQDVFDGAAYVAERWTQDDKLYTPEGKRWLEELRNQEAIIQEIFDDLKANWDEGEW